MIEYLSRAETQYLSRLASGLGDATDFTDKERCELIAKLKRLGEWAEREDAARERLRAM